MIKALALIALLASPVLAKGPKYSFPDPKLNDELENVYYDISNIGKIGPVIGKVLQSTFTTTTTQTTTTSTSFVNTTSTAKITPTSTTNKIFVFVFGQAYNNSPATNTAYFTITGTTNGNLGNGNSGLGVFVADAAMNGFQIPTVISAVDSPGVTTEQTYTLQIRSQVGAATTGWNTGATKSHMIVMEIKVP